MVGDYKADQRRLIEPLLKYGINGCYSQITLNVPQVYKMIAVFVGLLTCVCAVVVLFIRKRRKA